MINLALEDHPEALDAEEQRLAAHGIGYTHIPVPFGAPTEAHYAAFCDALDAAKGPVRVHCIMNYRVSAFFYRRHREQGLGEAAARALMAVQWQPDCSENPAAGPWAELIIANA